MEILESVLWFLMHEIGNVYVVVWLSLIGFIMVWFSKSKSIRWIGVGLHYTLGMLLLISVGVPFANVIVKDIQSFVFLLVLMVALPFYISLFLLALAIIETFVLLFRHRRKKESGGNV